MRSLLIDFTALLRERNINTTQLAVLTTLHQCEKAKAVTLAMAAKTTPASITGVLDTLEARGLIVSATHPDRRTRYVSISTTGRDLVSDIDQLLTSNTPQYAAA
jgi:DNA-binding MarR family transcriptional regulator